MTVVLKILIKREEKKKNKLQFLSHLSRKKYQLFSQKQELFKWIKVKNSLFKDATSVELWLHFFDIS